MRRCCLFRLWFMRYRLFLIMCGRERYTVRNDVGISVQKNRRNWIIDELDCAVWGGYRLFSSFFCIKKIQKKIILLKSGILEPLPINDDTVHSVWKQHIYHLIFVCYIYFLYIYILYFNVVSTTFLQGHSPRCICVNVQELLHSVGFATVQQPFFLFALDPFWLP